MPKTKPPLESCLGEPIPFYNGEVHLRFATDPYHEYYLVGPDGRLERVDGVTGVSGILDKSHYLKAWAVKVGMQKLLDTMPADVDESGNKLVSPILWSEFEEIVTKSKAAHTEHFTEAGDIGTEAHTIIENLIKNAIQHDDGIMAEKLVWGHSDERVQNCVKAALNWIREHQVRFLKTEHKVYSRIYNFAGTMDALAEVHACTRPVCCPKDYHRQLCVLDWKTSNQLSNDYLMQCAAYQQCEYEEFGKIIDARWILRIGKTEGDFESWYLPAETFEQDFQAFTYCLQLKRLMRKIETRMSDAKKNRTARKKAAKVMSCPKPQSKE